MKCKSCGAEIKEGNSVCEYCGSAVERAAARPHIIIKDSEHPVKSVVRVIGKVIIALACIWAVLIIITLVVVLNSDVIKNDYEYSSGVNHANDEMPKNETGLIGQVISCDVQGVASIEYQGHTYADIKILDQELIDWINDTNRSIDTVEICFATNEKGDISELGLLSSGFFIMEKEGDCYIAVRDEQVISFISALQLETGHYYGGYFSYPDMKLYSGEEKSLLTLTYMDAKCDKKESVTGQEYYTGENITVYKIQAKGKWYYCDKDTYETVQTGDLLKGYELCEDQGMAFIVRESGGD